MTPLLDARDISKQFSGVPVLKGIDFTLLAGQVHALMGGNGAGKSTLMKIIAGVETPDSGELSVAGESFTRLTPAQAHRLGIYLVPQEPLLFPNLTVRENILFRLPRERDREKRLAEKLRQLQCQLNLDATASTLEVADQQMVEILRGLMRNARILILDEPTASLTPGETERLFRQIRALQDLGVGIVFISHKLPEIRQLASHVSVMRDGAVVLSGETAQFDDNALIAAMTPVSRETSLSDTQKLWLALPGNRRTQAQDFPVLRVEDLTGEGFIDLSLEIYAGEIVGLAGLVGSGRTEFAETLYGLRPVRGGRVWLENQEITTEPVGSRLEKGLVYLPEDRPDTCLSLTNKAWFCGHEFYVDERVLVPRSPIGELINNHFDGLINHQPQHILDMCTGSGCIAIACAYAFPEAEVDAVDISTDALAVTEHNIEEHGLIHHVTPIRSDLFRDLPTLQYDLIVTNPPYVDAEDMSDLPNEYRHEPELGLASGSDGLKLTRRILACAPDYLTDDGVLICEVGNSMVHLIEQYPDVPFTWLEFDNGGDGVFMLTKAQLLDAREYFSIYKD